MTRVDSYPSRIGVTAAALCLVDSRPFGDADEHVCPGDVLQLVANGARFIDVTDDVRQLQTKRYDVHVTLRDFQA